LCSVQASSAFHTCETRRPLTAAQSLHWAQPSLASPPPTLSTSMASMSFMAKPTLAASSWHQKGCARCLCFARRRRGGSMTAAAVMDWPTTVPTSYELLQSDERWSNEFAEYLRATQQLQELEQLQAELLESIATADSLLHARRRQAGSEEVLLRRHGFYWLRCLVWLCLAVGWKVAGWPITFCVVAAERCAHCLVCLPLLACADSALERFLQLLLA
jgi:hypothetical protein